MRRKPISLLILSLVSIFIMIGCTNNGKNIVQTASPQKLEKETAPPLPKVVSEETKIPVVQGSYCWGRLGCADYADGKIMFKDATPIVISPGAAIKISIDYEPEPHRLTVQQLQDDGIVQYDETFQINLDDGVIKAPREKGIYYYWITAYWNPEAGEQSSGDSSSFFFIDIK